MANHFFSRSEQVKDSLDGYDAYFFLIEYLMKKSTLSNQWDM